MSSCCSSNSEAFASEMGKFLQFLSEYFEKILYNYVFTTGS